MHDGGVDGTESAAQRAGPKWGFCPKCKVALFVHVYASGQKAGKPYLFLNSKIKT